jgi:uncharacterized delta-60 repeat protein
VRNGVARILPNGLVDTSFDPGSGADGFVSSLLVLANGQVLVGGGFTSMDNISSKGVARLNTSGTLDTTYNVGAGVNLGGSVLAMAVQPDGKLIVAGDFSTFNNVPRHNIARLETNGSLDLTFDALTGPNDVVYAVAVQTDGKILLGGSFTMVDAFENFMVARLETNGLVDATWTPISGADNTVYALTLQPDGRALVGGSFSTYDGEARLSLARLQSNGMLDPTFNACRGMNGPVYAIALQTNGQPVIGDFTIYNDPARNYARLLDGAGFGVSRQLLQSCAAGCGFLRGGGEHSTGRQHHHWRRVQPRRGGRSCRAPIPPEIVQVRFNYASLGNITGPRGRPLSGRNGKSPGNLEFGRALIS